MNNEEKKRMEEDIARKEIEKKISGEIVLSEEPGDTIKKWRNIFKMSQRELADEIDVMPSVISDYELGRRKSPGIKMVKKIVNGMLSIDEKKGGEVIRNFSNLSSSNLLSGSIIDIEEYSKGITIKELCDAANIDIVVNKEQEDREIYGYSMIDSLKAILELSPSEFVKLYGLTSERALIFTKVSTGRSPLVAIKVTNLKPNVVILHGDINQLDDLAKRIAQVENIPVGICRSRELSELRDNLNSL